MLRTNPPKLILLTNVDRRRPQVFVLPDRLAASLWWSAAVTMAWLLVMSGVVRGGTIYVDSRLGNDRFNGRAQAPEGDASGPVQSLAAAARRAGAGDSIVLANRGTPYYGSLTLFGARHSGAGRLPFTIYGNGSTLSGAKPIAKGCWQHVTGDIWRVTPSNKTYYQLVLDGAAVPSADCDATSKSLPEIPEGEWCAWRGAVYFHAPAGVNPDTMSLSLADQQVGITLLDVDNVVIRDLTLKHYRLDGINAHDRAKNIVLENVTLEANGRAGLAVGGTSQVDVRDSHMQQNRTASVLITELGEANLENSQYDVKPTVVE
jgi:hypothetical protein